MRALSVEELGFVAGGQPSLPKPSLPNYRDLPPQPTEVVVVTAEKLKRDAFDRDGHYVDSAGAIWADGRAYDQARSQENTGAIWDNYLAGVQLGAGAGFTAGLVAAGIGAAPGTLAGTAIGLVVIGPANVLRGAFAGDYKPGRGADQP